MANIVYNRFLQELSRGNFSWNAGTTVRALLVSNASTYNPNPTHQTVQALFDNGLVEIQDAGYARGTIQNKTVSIDTANNRAVFNGDPVSFGAISPNKTIVAVVLFIRTGVSDVPSNDIPIAYIDTATGLPKQTSGGMIVVQPTDAGYFTLRQQTS